jgi:membrane associated rhomboid family serine protease
MSSLRKKFERFCFKNRNYGIPNLMLFVLIGIASTYIISTAGIAPQLIVYLHFDKNLIMQGQIWRLFTYVFLDFQSNSLLMILFMFAYYSISRQLENYWGTLRFNLYYFSSVLLTDIFCWFVCDSSFVYMANSLNMARYVHMSLFMAFATMNLDSGFLMCFIIPIKGWVLVLVDLGFTIYDILQMRQLFPFPFILYPLMALVNYVLFFGKDVINVIPLTLRARLAKPFRKNKPAPHKPIPFSPAAVHGPNTKPPFNHKCTVCGRTDVSDPQLEFRYCSRCSGFHCYCEDHISNHTHI